MRAIIISVGTELVTGQIVDTNSAYLADQLTKRGIAVIRHVTVDDNEQAIADTLRTAMEEAELVIVTGGIGPTPDDLTRKGVATALRRPLVENAEALAQIGAFFDRAKYRLSGANLVQALIPQGCDIIPNPNGTAPGFALSNETQQMFVLPGVPSEMRAMFTATLTPAISGRTSDRCTKTAVLRCFGVSEAEIGSLLADMMGPQQNPKVGTTATQGIIDIRILASADSEEKAETQIETTTQQIRCRLKSAVLMGNTLQEAVANLLIEQGKTVSTVESCTGGLVAKRLTDVPGSARCFLRGYVTYSDAAKTDNVFVPAVTIEEHGAVSEEVARAMATGCRTGAGSDFAIAITGIAGPGGGNSPEKPIGLVYIALASRAGVQVKRLIFGAHLGRRGIRDRSCKSALNWLRLTLLEGDE